MIKNKANKTKLYNPDHVNKTTMQKANQETLCSSIPKQPNSKEQSAKNIKFYKSDPNKKIKLTQASLENLWSKR